MTFPMQRCRRRTHIADVFVIHGSIIDSVFRRFPVVCVILFNLGFDERQHQVVVIDSQDLCCKLVNRIVQTN